MKKQEKVGIVLMIAGVLTIFVPAIKPVDPTAFEIMQLLIGCIILVIGVIRFIWSENDKQ